MRTPTLSKASADQGPNQLIVMQLTSEGNWRQRVLNAGPTGLVANTMWRWCLALVVKASQAAPLPGLSSG